MISDTPNNSHRIPPEHIEAVLNTPNGPRAIAAKEKRRREHVLEMHKQLSSEKDETYWASVKTLRDYVDTEFTSHEQFRESFDRATSPGHTIEAADAILSIIDSYSTKCVPSQIDRTKTYFRSAIGSADFEAGKTLYELGRGAMKALGMLAYENEELKELYNKAYMKFSHDGNKQLEAQVKMHESDNQRAIRESDNQNNDAALKIRVRESDNQRAIRVRESDNQNNDAAMKIRVRESDNQRLMHESNNQTDLAKQSFQLDARKKKEARKWKEAQNALASTTAALLPLDTSTDTTGNGDRAANSTTTSTSAWLEWKDPESGRSYYQKEGTEETTWVRPEVLVDAISTSPAVFQQQPPPQEQQPPQQPTGPEGASADPPLTGWVEWKDPESGRSYYQKEGTEETSWVRPEVLVDAISTSPAVFQQQLPPPQEQQPPQQPTGPEGASDPPLTDWVELTNLASGGRYYYNEVTGEITRDRPDVLISLSLSLDRHKESDPVFFYKTAFEFFCEFERKPVSRLIPQVSAGLIDKILREMWEKVEEESNGKSHYHQLESAELKAQTEMTLNEFCDPNGFCGPHDTSSDEGCWSTDDDDSNAVGGSLLKDDSRQDEESYDDQTDGW